MGGCGVVRVVAINLLFVLYLLTQSSILFLCYIINSTSANTALLNLLRRGMYLAAHILLQERVESRSLSSELNLPKTNK